MDLVSPQAESTNIFERKQPIAMRLRIRQVM